MSNLTTPKKFTKQDDGMAIPMINYDMTMGKFIINKDAIALIEGIVCPLGIISVAGMYRTGKSYLLNRMLLNRSGGFSVGPSINPCTKGLWMWNKAISCYSPDGKPLNALIIDTEGIGATDEDHNHDNKIMTLAILLSSYFIFNSLGTIDENAIQNLSFIVNITKSIQSKNTSNQLSFYLPSFMWVIRDFSLQLLNTEGHQITSREYLEKSLEHQKGTSDFIKSKNQIRTLVKEYFKERDCVTLVRPLTEEDNLQNLEKMESHKLRHEFIDQVNRLRKTVLNSIRPKSLNGQELNGVMLVNLIKSYVDMINQGAVPIIQTAWTYMCNSECAKAKDNSISLYNTKMANIEKKFPLDEEELRSYHKEIKHQAIENYNSSALGDIEQEKINEIKAAIKAKFQEAKEKNSSVLNVKMSQFLKDAFEEINSNVINGNYKSVSDYKTDIDNFITYAGESSPNGPNRAGAILQFVIENMIKHSQILNANSINEMEQIVANNKNSLSSMTKSISNTKEEYERLQKELDDKIARLGKYQGENASIIASAKKDTENYSKLVEEKTNQIAKLTERLSAIAKENQLKITEMKKEVERAEKNQREKERKYTGVSSEFEKEKVLLEQKLLFLEKTLKELNESKLSEVKTLKKDSLSSMANLKEQMQKYESQIKDLNKKISSMQEKLIDLETKLLQKDKRIENEKAKIEEMLNEYDKKLYELKNGNEQMEEEKEALIRQKKENEILIKTEYEDQIDHLIKENEESDLIFKEQEEQLRQQYVKLSNELSLLTLENENSEKKLGDIKYQLSNDKLEYDKYIKILEENNRKLLVQYEESVKENDELKSSQSTHLSQLTIELNNQQCLLQSENDELESQLKRLMEECSKVINELTARLSTNEKTILPEYQQRISILESQLEKYNNETMEIISNNKNSLEEINFAHTSEIHEILTQCREEIEENNDKNEKQILEIRKCLELEKEEIEKRIRENSEMSKERLNEIETENEERLKAVEKEKDAKIDELADNLDECEQIHHNYVMETDQEMALKMQQIDSLNKFLSDAKNSLQTIQIQHEESLKSQNERFINEKNEISIKIEELGEENKQNEIELEALNSKNKELEVLLVAITSNYDEAKDSYEREKKELEEKIAKLTQEYNKLNNELLTSKSAYAKEISLKQQEIEFLNQKLNEYKRQLEEFKASFDEKIAQCKEQIISEYTSKIQLIEKEKQTLELALAQVKSEYKSLEEKYQTETTQLTKEKEFLIEKLNSQTKKKKELTEILEKEREESQIKLNKIKEDFKTKNLQLTKENEVLQSKLKKIESEYTELSSLYEKDSNVWTNKFHYLEEQRDIAKKELLDVKEKYEITMDDLQKKILAERERLDSIYKASLAKRAESHNQQIENANKLFYSKYEKIEMQNKSLSSENKTLKEKIVKYEDDGALKQIEAELVIAIAAESKIKEEYEEMMRVKGGKADDLKMKLSAERENYNKRMRELERKLQDYEGKRSNLAVDIVKQKAVSEKDKENKVNIIQKLNDKLKELEKINMRLMAASKETLKENEHMRKNSRNSSSSRGESGYIPKYRMNSGNKENLKTQGNIQVDKLNFLPVGQKIKTIKDSQRSDEDNRY